ncbi:MAG: FAD-binding protein [Gammaproteobacteria bacterium]|nr:FAD-binding protein [Gammaproteobacteria bacterium]
MRTHPSECVVHDIDRDRLIRELGAVLPAHAILFEPEDTRPYECDGLSAYRRLPWLVVLPDSVAQVCEVMRICAAHGVPLVPRGAGTGLSGGALPLENGVLLSLARLNRILAIDPLARTARVEPGVRNLAISEAAAAHGLYYAPDPSSQIACSIGGNVAENAGGVHCLKYGLTVHNVLKLTVLTIDGTVIEIGGDGFDAPGYDLLALTTGSEGLLGVVIEVTVRLLPLPETARLLLASFASITDAAAAVGAVIAAGIIPAGLEMMDRLAIRAAEDFVHAGYPLDCAAILLCELDGARADVDEQFARLTEIFRAERATELRIARDDAERLRFWQGRKSAFPAVGRLAPDYYCMDGTIPRHRLGHVLDRIAALSDEYGLPVANVFHAGDGNLHPLILYDANKPGELARTEEFGARILEYSVEVGGTITGEHGVGVEKIDQMCAQFTPEELAQFHAVKAAFDPRGLLNPGKAVPTLPRCAEFGAVHVHRGQVPHGASAHPGIERF